MAGARSGSAAHPRTGTCASTPLKHGRFGSVCLITTPGGEDERAARFLERDTRTAHWAWRAVARRLAAREARVLAALARVPNVPKLAQWDGHCLRRSWLEGAPMPAGHAFDRARFREALRLVRRMHAVGIVNNDLARPKAWLVTPDGPPALVGFRSAVRVRYRGRRFRALAYADLCDLLEHRRAQGDDTLTPRQRALLARRRSWIERAWRWLARPYGSIVSNSSVGASPGRK